MFNPDKAVYVGDDGVDDLPLGCTSRLIEVDVLVDGDTLFLAHASGTLSHIKNKIELEVLGEQEGGLSAARKWDFGQFSTFISFEVRYPKSYRKKVRKSQIPNIRWSPDGELLVLISSNLTGEDSLQLLTADYEPVSVQQAVTESSVGLSTLRFFKSSFLF